MVSDECLIKEIRFDAVRSRGPGGQNVNKVSSAALLTWDFGNSACISEFQKHLVREKLASVINKDEMLYLRSDEFRDLERNKSRCIEKLLSLLRQAFHRPKPRKKTKPTKASKKKRVDSKKRRGENKKMRQKVSY